MSEELGDLFQMQLDRAANQYETQQRAQAQAQQQQAAMMQQHADSAQKLGATPTQGGNSTALDDVMNAFSGYGSPAPQAIGA